MGMELTHSFTVPASPERTWALLTDLTQVGGCFPGATVTEDSGDTFAGTVKVKLGPIAMQYAGTGLFLERDDSAHRAVIEGKGKDKRGNGTANARATLQLSPSGAGTHVEVVTDLSVTGKPAQFGRGVMQDVSDKLLGQFVQCLENRLGEEEAGTATVDDGDAGAAEPRLGADAGAATPPGEPHEDAGPTPDDFGVGADPVGQTRSPMTTPVDVAVPGEGGGQLGTPGVDPAEPASGAVQPGAGMATVHRAGELRGQGRGQGVDEDDAIDLGDLVGPVLRERYGMAAAAGLAGVLIGIAIGRGARG